MRKEYLYIEITQQLFDIPGAAKETSGSFVQIISFLESFVRDIPAIPILQPYYIFNATLFDQLQDVAVQLSGLLIAVVSNGT